MDVEMKSKNYTYFSERSYTGKDCKIDDKVVDYWKKVLGDNVFNNIEKVYNFRPEIVMSKKDFENVTESKEILQFSELFQTEFGENVKYQLKIGEKGAFVFDRFLDHFIKFGIAVLNEQEIDECIMDSYIDNIIRQISKISMGTLMFEMYICREQGLLVGNNSNEEYVYYNTHFLGDKKYINELFEIYPCLERMIFESIFYLVNNYKELLIRLKKDHDYLVEQLCDRKKFKKVVKMQSDISDSHKRGKTVSVLTLDNDVKVVYKPRSLKGEKAYQDFQTYISQGSKLKARTFKVIDCGNYGWEEFVESKPCSDMQQLRNYYYRFGELILQNYILNANDLHEENVIAYGEYPIVIDAETILDNHIELSKQNSREIINEKIRDSVLFSGLLPNYRFSNKGKGIDMSAIMGKEGDEYPILIPRIAEIGTSNMHYEYVHPIKTANNNLATLNGKFIAPATFIKEIDQGFRDAYRFIMEHKQSTIEKMKIFENIIVRHLIQDTQRYSMILHTSYHPDFLQDGKDRELVLCSIMGHIDEVEKSNKVAELEIKDMLHMDVPYFYINTSCNSLFGTDNKEISNYFETSSICKVKEKICGMTIGAMEEQSRFLKIALTDLNDYKITRKNGNIIRNNISGTFDMRRKQDAIERLAENLLHDAVITPDKHDVNWIGVSSVGSDENSTWQIQPLGNYLYEGLAGIAIFFHALCQSLKIEKYKFVCDALDQNLFTYTKEMEQKVEGIENESSGILCGEAALVYTYEILYQITKHKIYLEYARRHCEILKKTIDNDMYYDLVYGNAGAILALLNLYDLTGEEEYLRIADLAGEKLFASQQFEENTRKGWLGAGSKYPLAGFSHGVAGIAYSLVKLWSYTQKEKYLQAVVASIRFENSLYDDKIGNWKDEREYNGHKSSEQNIYMTAWCHGAAGILLSRCKIMQFDIDKELQDELNKDIKTALATTLKYGFGENDCLCHGNLGNTEILMEYGRMFNDIKTLDLCGEIREAACKRILGANYDSGRSYLYGYQIPGFMTGLSGMGYSLLRDINKELPCILSLEI